MKDHKWFQLLFIAAGGVGCGSSDSFENWDASGDSSGSSSSGGSSSGAGAIEAGADSASASSGSSGGAREAGSASGSGGGTSEGGGASDAGRPLVDAAGAGDSSAAGSDSGAWLGLQVSGTKFVYPNGNEFIPKGIGVGEWLNIESYMLDLNLPSDSPGLGQTRLRNGLVAAAGQSAADQFFATWRANVVTAADVALWAQWGANSVRLPLNYHALTSADGVYIDAGFAIVDTFISWCKANGIYVVLDLHAAPGGQNCEEMSDTLDGIAHLWTEPNLYRNWTIDLWRTIAQRYAGETTVAGYDLMDEPYDDERTGEVTAGRGTLRALYVDITNAIRSVDPHHILFIEGANWSSIDQTMGTQGFTGLDPAWDPQMAWSFHWYSQATSTLPSSAADTQWFVDWRTQTNRPVWNGETGEDAIPGWSHAMITVLGNVGIGWNMWTYKKVNTPENYYSINPPSGWGAMTTYLQSYAAGTSATAPSNASSILAQLAANAATSQCMLNAQWLKDTFNK